MWPFIDPLFNQIMLKKRSIFTFCIMLFAIVFSSAQTTFVPDDNFEQALIDLGYDSGALDDYVPTANISNVLFLDVNNENISDFTGIAGFLSLENLICNSNNLTAIDVSALTNQGIRI